MTHARLTTRTLAVLFAHACSLDVAAASAETLAPQSAKELRREAEQARKVLANREGRYRAKGSFDMSTGFGDQPKPLPMAGEYAAETLFEGRLVLERSATRFGQSQDVIETWSLLAYRPDAKFFWQLSCDSSRTPFTYLAGPSVDGELRLADPKKTVYSLMAADEAGGWSSKFGLMGSKRPMFTLQMSPVRMETPVELLAELQRAPPVPARLNKRRDDDDKAKHWHEEHALLARLAGDYVVKGKKGRVRARVVAQGRFLIWLTESKGLLQEVALTGFSGPDGKYAHWRVAADDVVPHYFTGTFDKDRLQLDGYGSSGKILLDLRKADRVKWARRGTGGKGRVELVRTSATKQR